MVGGRRRALGRAVFAASGACLALSFGLPALAQDEGPVRPAVWHGAAVSEGITLEIDRDALLPVPHALRFTALQGTSTYDTDLHTARASILYPGEGVLQGPNLVCGTFGASFPPEAKPLLDLCATYDFPLSVAADESTPEKSSLGGVHLGKATDPLSVEAVAARAKADVDGALSDATIEDLRVLGLPAFDVIPLLPIEELTLDPSIARVESATSRTDQRIDPDGTLVVEAKVTLSGVRLVGGLVRIGSIVSSSKVTDDGEGKRTADGSFDVTGVTVAGIPARITEDGLVLGSPSGTGPIGQQLASAVQQLLGGLGLKLSLVAGEETLDDGTGTASASAGGIILELGLNADGLPTVPGPLGDIDLNGTYVGSLRLGYSAASGGATANFDDGTADGVGGDDGVVLPELGGDFGSDLGADLGSDLGSGPVTPSRPGGTDGPTVPVSRTAAPDLFGGRLELLYAAFALAVLGLCITPRLALTARLPGPRA